MAIRSLSLTRDLLQTELEIFRAMRFYSKFLTEKRQSRVHYHALLAPRLEESYNSWSKINDFSFLQEIGEYRDLINSNRNIYTVVTLPLKVGNSWDLINFDCQSRRIVAIHFGIPSHDHARQTTRVELGAQMVKDQLILQGIRFDGNL